MPYISGFVDWAQSELIFIVLRELNRKLQGKILATVSVATEAPSYQASAAVILENQKDIFMLAAFSGILFEKINQLYNVYRF